MNWWCWIAELQIYLKAYQRIINHEVIIEASLKIYMDRKMRTCGWFDSIYAWIDEVVGCSSRSSSKLYVVASAVQCGGHQIRRMISTGSDPILVTFSLRRGRSYRFPPKAGEARMNETSRDSSCFALLCSLEKRVGAQCTSLLSLWWSYRTLLLVVVVESEFLPLQLAEFTQHNANNVRKGHT
jgi:hypothetical protein